MSIYVSNIRLPFTEPEYIAIDEAYKRCKISHTQVRQAFIYRVSIDARRGNINKVYTVVLDGVENEQKIAEKLNDLNIRFREINEFSLQTGKKTLNHRPVVIGFGPAGLFASYILAKYGYSPIVIERGDEIGVRDKKVNDFWQNKILDLDSNIQFGEGGAGTYSDGKLTTRINDPRCDEVLKILVKFNAPHEIIRQAKPHIGTDILKNVVVGMRKEIIRLGGEVHFNTALKGVKLNQGSLVAIQTQNGEIPCEQAILAIGHSARDTFEMLNANGVHLEPKPFSVGVRIEHLQEKINRALYGNSVDKLNLPSAEYNLSHKENGRACYSFCMCPGGHVVAAQSELNTVVTNGMSYHARDGLNANSALAVSVDPADFSDGTALGGIAFQRKIESMAFKASGGYQAPCQTVGDFLNDRPSKRSGVVKPTYPMGVSYGSISDCLPDFVVNQLKTGLAVFGKKIRGFDDKDALMTAPETRTSSPVRIVRGEDLYSLTASGLIPCGEGAGYAGGIMSAGVDGIRTASHIIEQYAPIQN